MTGKIPCRRCLPDIGDTEDIKEAINQRIALLPEDVKSDNELFSKRLAVCDKCESLNQGTCAKCGCYVMLRAAKRHNHCPAVPAKW